MQLDFYRLVRLDETNINSIELLVFSIFAIIFANSDNIICKVIKLLNGTLLLLDHLNLDESIAVDCHK